MNANWENTQVPQAVGLDEGAGSIKVYTAAGATEFVSQIAHNGTAAPGAVAGLESLTPPLQIAFSGGTFYTGPGAHGWGRPVENLDFGRFAGSPEMAAVIYGAFTRHVEAYGALSALRLKVGLPQQALAGESGQEIIPGVKGWLTGDHQWTARNGHVPPAARAAAEAAYFCRACLRLPEAVVVARLASSTGGAMNKGRFKESWRVTHRLSTGRMSQAVGVCKKNNMVY